MPFVSNMNNEEEKTNQPNGGQGPVSPTGSGGGAVHLAPSSSVPTVGGGGSSGSGPTAAGGSFASLDKYLAANQGQAEPLAGKLTSGIGQQYSTLQNQNTSTLADINNQVSANAVPRNYADTLSQEAANPVSFASDTGNVGKFQELLKAAYSGPASAESTPGFTAQQNAVNTAIANGKNATQTEAGRENLLTQNEATPTTGVTALNSAILSQSPTALKNVEGAYEPFSNLVSGLSSGAADINKQIATNSANASAANTAANKQITDQVNALNSNLTTTAEKNAAAQNLYNQNLQAEQTGGAAANSALNNLSALMKQYFPSAVAVTNPFAPVLSNKTSNVSYTPATVATTEDYQKAQAFQNLLNGLDLGAPAPVITSATMDQAGTGIVPTGELPSLNTLATNAAGQFAVGQPLGSTPAKSYEDTQNWTHIIDPAWVNVLQQLNKLNPSVWAPK